PPLAAFFPYTTLFLSPCSRGNPFLPAFAGQKFLPPGIPLGTKLSAELRTRRKAARTLSALNFPVCVPSIRTCRLDGTFLKDAEKDRKSTRLNSSHVSI